MMKKNLYAVIKQATQGLCRVSDPKDPICIFNFIQGCRIFVRYEEQFEDTPPFEIFCKTKIVKNLVATPDKRVGLDEFIEEMEMFSRRRKVWSAVVHQCSGRIVSVEEWKNDLDSIFCIKVKSQINQFYENEIYKDVEQCMTHAKLICDEKVDEYCDFLDELQRKGE